MYNVKLPERQKPTPMYNYLSGTGKSHVWSSRAYYVPSERSWTSLHDYRSLPRETKRDAIEMKSEDQWVDFMRKRDTPYGYYHKDVGLSPCQHPELKLFGYTRNLPGMPSKDVLQNPRLQPTGAERAPRGEYYGYYHEAIENERERRKKAYPTSMRIDPRDIPKL